MGFLEQINEAARRTRTGDDWYVTEQPYILQILTSPLNTYGITPAGIVMVLPLAPEQYRVSRTMRQSVTPTLGGLVVEERGLLWRDISVTGTFGLEPKAATDRLGLAYGDTTTGPDLPVPLASEKLSGPGWTRRMVRNVFERYAALKSDALTAAETQLIWHDVKTGDSWVVVPVSIDVERSASRRMQYPWSFQLRAIADADAVKIPDGSSSLLSKIRGVLATIGKALDTVNAAIQEGSAFLGEVRFFVAQVDSVIDRVTTIVRSAQDFVDGVASTLAVGQVFVSSTAALLDETLALIEQAEDLPNEVRQNFQSMQDGIHAIGAQFSAFGKSYEDEAAPVLRAEAGARGDDRAELDRAAAAGPATSAAAFAAARTLSTDAGLVDADAVPEGRLIGSYTGTMDYVISAGDSLLSIAARLIGDGSRWWDIAVFNGLQAPYISEAGAPGTVTIGDTIAIPVSTPTGSTAVARTDDELTAQDRLGTDIALKETLASRPGRPAVAIQIDERTRRDVATISGLPNLTQALQLRLWTERGTMALVPGYGMPQAIGAKQSQAFVALLGQQVRQTVKQDSRVRAIRGLRTIATNDLIEFALDVVPIGTPNSAQAVTLAVV